MQWFFRLFEERRRAVAMVAVALVAVRLQTLFIEFYNGDEANYAGHALVMLGGGVPYVDFVEKKPPLIYCFYWLLFGGFGPSLRLVHFVTIVWVAATCWFLAKTVSLALPRAHAAAAALLYALFSTCFIERDMLATNCEILMNLPAMISVFLIFKGELTDGGRWRIRSLFASGLFCSFAFLFKHQAGIGLAVTGLWVLGRRDRLRALAALGAGFLLPVAAVVAFYAHIGRLAELYEWNVLTNFTYVGATQPPLEVAATAATMTAAFVGANLLPFALAGLLAVGRLRRAWLDAGATALVKYHALWAVATLLPISMGGRFYGHYYIQLYPPLCVLAGIAAGELIARRDRVAPAVRATFFAALVLPALVFQVLGVVRYDQEEFQGAQRFHRPVADAIAAASAPNDEIFVWGNYAYPYYLARRQPGARYIVCEYVLPFWETHLGHRDHFTDADWRPHQRANYQRLLDDLRRHRPRLIVDTSRSPHFEEWHWSAFSIDRFSELAQLVQADYEPLTTVEGVTIFRRKSAK
jgi:4-amino-4-deoxy-L-arabinose transferase-like glycosyltransferase